MSHKKTTYSDFSDSFSASSYGAGGYDTWAKVTAEYYSSGTTLYFRLSTASTGYPYMKVEFYVNGALAVNTGYVKTNSGSWPRGNGTNSGWKTWTIAESGTTTLTLNIGVSTSSTNGTSTVYPSKTPHYWYWNDINAWNPEKTDQNGAKFDVYYSYQNQTYTDRTNEPGPLYGPLNSWMRVFNVRPLNNTQEVYKISGYDGGEKNKSSDSKGGLPCYTDTDGNDAWWQYNDAGTGEINIYTRYKISTLTFDLNNGSWKPNSGITSNKRQMQYNSTTSNAPIPIRTGYKFLGWYTTRDGGTQVFKADGTYNSNATSYWNSSGVYRGINDLTLYANWKIQNVAYVKTENGWKLATVYVKTENGWEPAILYVKTSDGWEQSVV
jgi:uncharacterized repeat protein (TIGR02543 family)